MSKEDEVKEEVVETETEETVETEVESEKEDEPEKDDEGATSEEEAAQKTEEEELFDFDFKGEKKTYTAKELAAIIANYEPLKAQIGTEQNRRRDAEERLRAATEGREKPSKREADTDPESDDSDITFSPDDLGDSDALVGKLNRLVRKNLELKNREKKILSEAEERAEARLEKREVVRSHPVLKGMDKDDQEEIFDAAVKWATKQNAMGKGNFVTFSDAVDAYTKRFGIGGSKKEPKTEDAESQPRFVRRIRENNEGRVLDSTGGAASEDIVAKALSLISKPEELAKYMNKLEPSKREFVQETISKKVRPPGMES